MRTEYIQNSLNAGELSPKVDLRDDYDRYKSGVREMTNFIPLPYGGARTRFGLEWVCHTRDNGLAYLLSMVLPNGTGVVFEFGENYYRVFKDGARFVDGVPVSITNVANNGSGLYRVTTSATAWITNDYVSISGVVGMPDINQEWKITKITGTTFDLQGSTFSGAYVSGGTAYKPYQITTVYPVADVPGIKVTQYGLNLYLAHPSYPPQKIVVNSTFTSFTIGAVTFLDGPYMDINTTATTITPSATTGSVTLTASAAIFTANHVGSFWRLFIGSQWGYAKVTAFTDTTHVTATVILAFGGATATANWREGAWSAERGYPACNVFFEQRLGWAATAAEPQTVWLSTTNSPEDMTPSAASGTVAASDAVTYKLGSGRVNTIRWMLAGKNLFLGTIGEEFAMSGASSEAISATNPPIVTSTSTEGCADIQAVRLSNQTLFIQRTGRELRANKFDLVTDDFITQDASIVAEHLLRTSYATRMAVQNRPDHTLWIPRADGKWLSFTYYPVEQVQGWGRQGTDGTVIDITAIPSTDGRTDESWYVVQRTVGGVTKRFIERENQSMQVDAGLVYSGAATTSVTGLFHLEGRTVRVVGNGAVYDDQVVTNGSVDLEYGDTPGPAATTIYVGLAITPNPKIRTLPPAYKDDKGVVRGRFKHWATLFVSLFETMGLTINGNKQLQYRKPSDPMDSAPPVFTGDQPVPNLGWSRDGSVSFEQTLPLAATIRGYFGDLNVGD